MTLFSLKPTARERVESRRNFMKAGGASLITACVASPQMVARADAAQDAVNNDVILRVVVMSDVHFNGNKGAAEVERFQRAIRFGYDYAKSQPYDKFDALMVVGDMSNHGTEPEITLFKATMDAEIREGTAKLLCMGNHEFYGGSQEYWRSVFGVDPNARYEVNGFQFIAISPEKGTMQNGDYLYALDWVEEELRQASLADPSGEKPIFVFQHYPVSPTVYGGRGRDDWGAKDLYDTFQKYPQVVNFSGHTHYPINDPRCAWQGCFTAFGTGTLSYICHGGEGGKYEMYPAGSNQYAQFYIMEVRRDNSVALKPYDLMTNSFFDVVYYVAKPGDMSQYVYTDARYSKSAKPTWAEDSQKSLVVEPTYDSAVCRFKQATCPDVIHSYRFDLQRRNPETNQMEEAGRQYFWSQYFQRNLPNPLEIELVDLEASSYYEVKITAFNPFLRASDEQLSFSFKTKPSPYATVDQDAESPTPDFLDLRVVDGVVVNFAANDLPVQKKVQKIGDPKAIKDPAREQREVAIFDGAPNFYKIQCDKSDYRRLKRATIAATFKLDPDGKGVGGIFGNTEHRGVALSVNYDEKTISLWASINGQYHILKAPIPFDQYVTAFGVVDGKSVVLYLDGKEVAREDAEGVLTHPQDPAVQAFCLGCDIEAGGNGGYFMKGAVERAQLFSWALSPQQVANLSK